MQIMIYRRIIYGVVLILLSLAIQAQNVKQISIGSKSYDQFYGLKFNYDAGSNSLNNKMLFKFGLGGFIDNNLKQTNKDRIKTKNIFGQSSDFSFYYRQENRQIWGIKELGFQVALEWHNLLEAEFGPELYQLIFYGNKDNAGSSVDLSTIHFQSLNYYQIKGGLNKIFGHSKMGFNLSLNLGNNYSDASFNNTRFYTSFTGDSLALKSDISYKYQSLSSLSPVTIRGYGAGLDIFYAYDNPRLFKLEAKIENLGFIFWQDKSMEFQRNKPIIWEGFEVENLLQMPDPLMKKSPADSLKEYISTHSQSTKYRSYTPVNVEVKFKKMLVEDKIEAVVVVKYKHFSNYRPMVLLQSNFLLNEKISLSPNLSYGGYTGFNIGFELEYKLNNISELHLGTRYLGGYVLQNNFSGFGGFITFTYQI